ncbi:MAG TPA: hypothetical protein VFT69_03905 [Pseudolabrys sp.]|nr:hypothetical protein [Pseudolabrys sp.]
MSRGSAASSALDGGSQGASVTDSAKDFASRAGEKLRDSAEEQKAAGADYVSGIAGSVRRAADEFSNNVPQAAQYMRFAADRIDSVSDAFRKRDMSQLLADVQGFARQQPTAFIGATVLAGFAAVRFFKTSSSGADTGRRMAADGSLTRDDGLGLPASQSPAAGVAPNGM